ncbi:MAG: BRCT domain-containing protein [Pyrinomonadaceae bacterium]
MGNFFARRIATDKRVLKRSCESLLGICTGLMADGQLNDDEIRFLNLWLADNSDIALTWPGEVLVARIRSVLADGQITEEERAYLKQTLSDLLGGTLTETGAAGGTATRLPINDVEAIEVDGASFCFTGDFLFGPRKSCESAVTERGGVVLPGVQTDLDYLVIGTLASREWANTTFGRKIEKAMEYQRKGCSLLIVSEEQWVQFL